MKTEYHKIISNKAAQSEVVAQIENDFVATVKNHSRKLWKESAKIYFDERFKGILHELNNYMKVFSNGRIEINHGHIKQIELFLTTFLQFSRNSEIAKWIVQPNDAYDLYNLIYVRPGDKYFTMEKRWKNLITEAGLCNYLLVI